MRKVDRDGAMLLDARRLAVKIMASVPRREVRKIHRLLRNVVKAPPRRRDSLFDEERRTLRDMLSHMEDVLTAYDSYMTTHFEFPDVTTVRLV